MESLTLNPKSYALEFFFLYIPPPFAPLFCKVENPESIARQVQRLLADAQLRQTLIQNAPQLVAQKYDWNLLAPKMQNIFERLLG